MPTEPSSQWANLWGLTCLGTLFPSSLSFLPSFCILREFSNVIYVLGSSCFFSGCLSSLFDSILHSLFNFFYNSNSVSFLELLWPIIIPIYSCYSFLECFFPSPGVAASSFFTSGKYAIDPELRGAEFERITQNLDVHFWKTFWNITETEVLSVSRLSFTQTNAFRTCL